MTMIVVLAGTALLALVGAFDAARGGHWDQFAILLAIAALSWVGLSVRVPARRTVAPRADLLRWVREHAATTDDEPNRVVDRALAAYRAGLMPDEPLPDGAAEPSGDGPGPGG